MIPSDTSQFGRKQKWREVVEWNGIRSIQCHPTPSAFKVSKQWSGGKFHSAPLHCPRFHPSKRSLKTMVSKTQRIFILYKWFSITITILPVHFLLQITTPRLYPLSMSLSLISYLPISYQYHISFFVYFHIFLLLSY